MYPDGVTERNPRLRMRSTFQDEFTVRVMGPAPATNAFILTNAAGTDLRRADQFDFYSVRFTAGYRF